MKLAASRRQWRPGRTHTRNFCCENLPTAWQSRCRDDRITLKRIPQRYILVTWILLL